MVGFRAIAYLRSPPNLCCPYYIVLTILLYNTIACLLCMFVWFVNHQFPLILCSFAIDRTQIFIWNPAFVRYSSSFLFCIMNAAHNLPERHYTVQFR